MNSESKAIILSVFLASVLLTNVNLGNVFATGGLDDEEEEKAIKELQNDVKEINESIDGFSLDLKEGLNDIDATCPAVTAPPASTPSDPVIEEEEQIPPIEEETETTESNESSSQSGNEQVFVCQAISNEEEEDPATSNNNNTAAPPIITPNEPTCQPIPEPEPEPTLPPLEPLYCPYTGELLGYKNITSGELLPISAGNQTTTTAAEEEEEEPEEVNTGNGGGFLPPTVGGEGSESQETTATENQPVSNVEFDEGCGCFVINGSGVSGSESGISESQDSELGQ